MNLAGALRTRRGDGLTGRTIGFRIGAGRCADTERLGPGGRAGVACAIAAGARICFGIGRCARDAARETVCSAVTGCAAAETAPAVATVKTETDPLLFTPTPCAAA